jgi:outer membrane protein TolC
MKPIKQIVLLFLLPVQSMLAQEPVTLDQCQQWARENHPVLQQKGLYQQIAELKKVNDATAYLPQVNLNGQATYQSRNQNRLLSAQWEYKPVDKDQYKSISTETDDLGRRSYRRPKRWRPSGE